MVVSSRLYCIANFLIFLVIRIDIIVSGSWSPGFFNFSSVGTICSKRYCEEQSIVIELKRFAKSERNLKSVHNLNLLKLIINVNKYYYDVYCCSTIKTNPVN